MDRPPACHFASVQDGKQEIYLEWPNAIYRHSTAISADNSLLHSIRVAYSATSISHL